MQPKMTPRYAVGMARRFLLVLLLTFSVNQVWTTVMGHRDGGGVAYATESQDGGEKASEEDKDSGEKADDPKGESKEDPKEESKEPQKEDPAIEDVAVVLAGTDKALGYASKGHFTQDGTISKKGGTLDVFRQADYS